jgi:CTP-dependent riboflavin kinase
MCLTFLGLAFVQFNYFNTLVDMRREFFEDAVKQALYRTSRILEEEEMQRYINAELIKQGKAPEVVETETEFINKSINPLNIKPLTQNKKVIKNNVKGTNSVSDISKNLHKEHQKTFNSKKLYFLT